MRIEHENLRAGRVNIYAGNLDGSVVLWRFFALLE